MPLPGDYESRQIATPNEITLTLSMDKAPEPIHSSTDQKRKCYAIIPAAGRSHRMGTSKLLLPWPSPKRPNGLVIEQVIEAWTRSNVAKTIIVIRKKDKSGVIEACKNLPAHIVFADEPPDMTASIQAGLKYIIKHKNPSPNDSFLIAPADLPTLSSQLINRVLAFDPNFSQIVVPIFGGKRGHPVLFPWRFYNDVFRLPIDAGVNQILEKNKESAIALPVEEHLQDIDTPKEYRRALNGWKSKISKNNST